MIGKIPGGKSAATSSTAIKADPAKAIKTDPAKNSDAIQDSVYSVLANITSLNPENENNLVTLIAHLKGQDMRGVSAASIALEILQPFYIFKLIETEMNQAVQLKAAQQPDSAKNKSDPFIEATKTIDAPLLAFFTRSAKKDDESKSASTPEDIPAKKVDESQPASTPDELIKKLEEAGVSIQERKKAELIRLLNEYQIRARVGNTCYLHAALNIAFRDPVVWGLITASNPESQDGNTIKTLLNGLRSNYLKEDNSKIEEDKNFLALLNQCSELLTAVNSETESSTSRQQDAEEMLSRIFEKLDIKVCIDVSDKDQLGEAKVFIQKQAVELGAVTDKDDTNSFTIASILVFTGRADTSDNGVSATSGHYMSLVKTEPTEDRTEKWQLYNNQTLIKEYTGTDLQAILGDVQQVCEMQNPLCRGIYTRQQA